MVYTRYQFHATVMGCKSHSRVPSTEFEVHTKQQSADKTAYHERSVTKSFRASSSAKV